MLNAQAPKTDNPCFPADGRLGNKQNSRRIFFREKAVALFHLRTKNTNLKCMRAARSGRSSSLRHRNPHLD
jgi:hypothetical protein